MNIIGNFSLSTSLTTYLQAHLPEMPNTAIQVRDFLEVNPTAKRVVIKTDMDGWQQVRQLINEYGIA